MPRRRREGLTGKEKAAVLLIALGPETSAKVLKHLKEEEIEQITLEVASMRKIPPQLKDEVIREFQDMLIAREFVGKGGIDYARTMLEKALGKDRAENILGKLTASLQVRPFESVRRADPSQVLNFLQGEHPQTIALVLAYMNPDQAAAVLSGLPPELQVDVARRLATMDRTSPETLRDVERVLEKKLSSVALRDFAQAGGIDAVVEVLNSVDRTTEKNILDSLEEQDPELADEIRKRLFVFEDVVKLDDRSVQRVLREVDMKDLALALKGASEDVKDKFFHNMSKRAAAMLKEDMEFMGPVRVKDVEEAQQKIVNVIRQLEESGEIIVSRGGEEEIIV
ncbi:MAG: flagellar motor switch protein FliG [Synergistetes bacterium]|nr:flagellar motor switch protein FliG [Synergistota bacterium]